MRAEILSIGTELLLGQIIDTNAAYLAERLAELGLPLYYMATVGDNAARLEATLRTAYARAEVIICTGGLGPTEDDITAAGIAAVFDAPLEMREEARQSITDFFAQRNRPISENQFKQALLPQGATLVPNPTGTAPGFILEKDGRIAVALPGPPSEMMPMWRETVAPYLHARSGAVIHSRTLRFCGIGEGPLEVKLKELIDAQANPTIAPYAKLGEVHIRVTAQAESVEEAERLIAPVEAQIRDRAGEFLYGVDEETLESVVGRLLGERGFTLGVAESCTGGLLGGRLTGVAGSSDYFRGGVITYSDDLKRDLLHVPEEILTAHGAVSVETACAMAAGAVAATGADLGVSITGIAGPGGATTDKPVGLVYIGVAQRDIGARAFRYLFGGDRETTRRRAVQEALVLLRQLLVGTEVTYW